MNGLFEMLLVVLGQEPEYPKAPSGSLWPALLLALFFGIAVVLASIMSSRRGHQD